MSRPSRHPFPAAIPTLLVCALCLVSPGPRAGDESPSATASGTSTAVVVPVSPFQEWLTAFRAQARAQGITEATLASALDGLQPIERVVELDRRQPEFIDTFLNYLNVRVNTTRMEAGREMIAWHQDLLAEVERRYGIPARYLVALWGLETNYGRFLGDTPVIAALATLAFDGRRAEFFRVQLLAALRILDEGHASPATLLGSWAGAMGQMQFIPTTFQQYAVDADGDGRKDIWTNLADALHSAANYLSKAGWRADEGWGQEVLLPEGFDLRLASLGVRKPLREWSALGVRQAGGEALPDCDRSGAVVLPQGHAGPAFLVQHNFGVIMNWNRSVNYALAVGHLADRLIGLPGLRTGLGADNRRLSREQLIELQRNLVQLGFDAGEPDGIPGSRTRAAIRAFQATAGLPPDGYPSMDLLERLQAAMSAKPAPETPAGEPASPESASSRQSGRQST